MAEPDRNDSNINGSRWSTSYTQFTYDGRPENASDVRNCMLVVSTVLAAVTFMAAMSPPGGVWQETVRGQKDHVAGKSVYATSDSEQGRFYTFVVCNTVAFTSSILIIESLSVKFPYYWDLVVAVNAMLFSYVISITAVVPKSQSLICSLLLIASILVPVVFRGVRRIYINSTT